LVSPAKSNCGFLSSGTVANAPDQFSETLDIPICWNMLSTMEATSKITFGFQEILKFPGQLPSLTRDFPSACPRARARRPVEGNHVKRSSNVLPLAAPFRQRARRSHALFFSFASTTDTSCSPPRRFLLRSARRERGSPVHLLLLLARYTRGEFIPTRLNTATSPPPPHNLP